MGNVAVLCLDCLLGTEQLMRRRQQSQERRERERWRSTSE